MTKEKTYKKICLNIQSDRTIRQRLLFKKLFLKNFTIKLKKAVTNQFKKLLK